MKRATRTCQQLARPTVFARRVAPLSQRCRISDARKMVEVPLAAAQPRSINQVRKIIMIKPDQLTKLRPSSHAIGFHLDKHNNLSQITHAHHGSSLMRHSGRSCHFQKRPFSGRIIDNSHHHKSILQKNNNPLQITTHRRKTSLQIPQIESPNTKVGIRYFFTHRFSLFSGWGNPATNFFISNSETNKQNNDTERNKNDPNHTQRDREALNLPTTRFVPRPKALSRIPAHGVLKELSECTTTHDFNLAFQYFFKRRDKANLKLYWEELKKRSNLKGSDCAPNPQSYIYMINVYKTEKKVDEALKLINEAFTKFPDMPNSEKADIWVCVLNLYAAQGDTSVLLQVLEALKQEPLILNLLHLNIVLSFFVETKQKERFWKLFNEMEEMEPHLQPSVISYNLALNMYQESDPNQALELVEQMMMRRMFDQVTVSVAMSILIAQQRYQEAVEMFESRVRFIKCDLVLASQYLQALGRVGRFNDLIYFFANTKKLWGLQPNRLMYNMLLDIVGKSGQMHILEVLLDMMEKHGLSWDTITYRTLINVYGLSEATWSRAVLIFEDFKSQAKVNNRIADFSIEAYNVLIKCAARLNKFEEVSKYHQEALTSGLKWNTHTFNSLIFAYSRARQWSDVEAVLRALQESDKQPDSLTYTLLLRAYGASEQWPRFFSVWAEASSSRALRSVLPVFFELCPDGVLARQVREQYMTRDWFGMDEWTGALFGSVRRGQKEEMRAIVREMEKKSVVVDVRILEAVLEAVPEANRSVAQKECLLALLKESGERPRYAPQPWRALSTEEAEVFQSVLDGARHVSETQLDE